MSTTFSKGFIYTQAIFWGCGVLIGSVFIVVQIFRQYERTPYVKYIGDYIEKPQNNLLHRYSVPKESIVITGKLVVVNLKDKTIDPVFNDLPTELKPQNPEQVKTVLWIQCNPSVSSLKYVDGSAAFNNLCILTFVDFQNKKYLWSDEVTTSPPYSKHRGTDAEVSDPSNTILDFLKGIPHKD